MRASNGFTEERNEVENSNVKLKGLYSGTYDEETK